MRSKAGLISMNRPLAISTIVSAMGLAWKAVSNFFSESRNACSAPLLAVMSCDTRRRQLRPATWIGSTLCRMVRRCPLFVSTSTSTSRTRPSAASVARSRSASAGLARMFNSWGERPMTSARV